MENEEVTNGQPLWMLLAIPVFLLVWWMTGETELVFRLIYSVLAALGIASLAFAIFVWVPNDQARKLRRRIRFEKSEKLISANRKSLRKISDKAVQENMSKAISIIEGLVNDLKAKSVYQGIIEENLVPALEDCLVQLDRWYLDQNNEMPLKEAEKEELFTLLTKKDELFLSWQNSEIDPTGYLTSKFRSQNQMQSAGINPKKESHDY